MNNSLSTLYDKSRLGVKEINSRIIQAWMQFSVWKASLWSKNVIRLVKCNLSGVIIKKNSMLYGVEA